MPVFWFKKFDCGTNVYFGLERTLRDGILVDISCWVYCLLIRNTTISLKRTSTFWSISQPAFTCSKLTIKTPKRRQWCRFGVFIVSFEYISHLCSSVSIVNFEHVIDVWDMTTFVKNFTWYYSLYALLIEVGIHRFSKKHFLT